MTMTGALPLPGRAEDLARASRALDAISRGRLQVVLIEGEAGIGKSALARALLDTIDDGVQVLASAGHELERERPFGVVADALNLSSGSDDPRRRAIAGLLAAEPPGVAGGGPSTAADFPAVRYHAVEAIVELVDHLAAASPILLFLEDLHWADPSSVLVVSQLARRLTDRPVGLLATLRPSFQAGALGSLQRELSAERVVRLPLEPLGADAVCELAARATGAPPDSRLMRVLAKAGGNPFFLHELLAALDDHDALHVRGGTTGVEEDSAPPSLHQTVIGRLGFLNHDCFQLLRTASLLGSRFSVDDLSVVLASPASDLLPRLDEALVGGVVAESERMISFRHDLVRDALYGELPTSARQALHLQAARRLAAAGRDPVEVAPHYLAGAQPGDREAVDWLSRAAADALARAPTAAADLLSAAIRLCGHDDQRREHLLIELATALTWAGRLDEAEKLLTDLVDRPLSRDLDARLRLALGRVTMIQGRAPNAAQRFDELAAAGLLTGRDEARALADAATARLLSGDLSGAERDATRALELGRKLDDDSAVCGALSALTWTTNLQGRTASAVAIGEQAVRVVETSAARETGRRYPYCYLGSVLMDADRFDEALHLYDVGRRAAEAYGDTWQLPIHHWGAVLASFFEGRLDDVSAALDTAAGVVDEVGTSMLVVWSHAVAAHVAIRRDELREAEQRLAEADEAVAELGPGIGFDWLLWARSLLLDASSDREAAVEMLHNAWELAAALGILAQRRLIGPDLVRLLVANGDHDAAIDVAAAMAETARVSGVDGARAVALRCRGLAHADPEAARSAVTLLRGGPRRLELADACIDAASTLAAAGRRAEAIESLREASSLYRTAGAVRDERRADAELRVLGVARGRRGKRSRPTLGWGSLTPTEREVTKLATEGLTNPQIGQRLFISPRTVETHLSHVFGKLGVSSRVELAAAAARRGPA